MKRPILVATCCALVLMCTSACSSAGSSHSSSAPKKKKSKQEQAAATDPLHALTLMRHGVVLMQQGRYDEARERFNEADRIAPGNATNYNMIGLCYMREGEFDEALAQFNRAIDLVPLFTDARNNRGATYLAMGQYHLAEVDFLAVLGDSTYPHAREVQYNLGLTYLERDNVGAAEESFRKSIVPPNPVFDGYLQLSAIAQKKGDLEGAKALLEQAMLKFPDAIEASLEMGKVLILMGQEDEARPYLEQVIEDQPGSELADSARALLGES
jgi:tetratricopeptide (TPR) repeat protein